jgi:hypothetical protein
MKKNLWLLLALPLLVLAGCASVPTAPTEQDAKAKDFSPLSGKATLFIYRNESFGAAIPMTVIVNGKSLGQTAAQTYFRLNVLPGKYDVESHAENVSTVSISAEAGKNYFVWQEVKMGFWMARTLVQQVDEKTGRAGVMESKLIAISLQDGEPAPQGSAPKSAAQQLRDLEQLRKDGVITEDEFQKKRQPLIDKL